MGKKKEWIRSGVCVCGHSWEDHHCGMIMNEDTLSNLPEGHPPYIPQECEHYGFDEFGGLDADGNEHCQYYRDTEIKYD
jgi:hypothetical protein